ncbi:MAG: adenylyl-sulfate kinase [Candidatus Hydrogenedentota bacterium]|nr:MAG: adenylyl-sulfate kinase [Candidatus Hydrogenedentota bacterium]
MTDENKSTNVVWHQGEIGQADREKQAGHKGAVLWFTGLSGSGKSTLADAVEAALYKRGCRTYVLDGDNIRHGLNQNLGFSDEDRTENIRRIGEVTRLFCDAGVIALTAFISPFQSDRDAVRELNGDRFIEVFVNTPIEVCEQRDPKGLYKKARAGEIPEFTGITSPYEAPEAPDIDVRTADQSLEESVQQVVHYLEANGFLSVS